MERRSLYRTSTMSVLLTACFAPTPVLAQGSSDGLNQEVYCSAVLWEESRWWQSKAIAMAYRSAAQNLRDRIQAEVGNATLATEFATAAARAAELAESDSSAFTVEVEACEEIAGYSGPDWFEPLAQDVGYELWCGAVLYQESSFWWDTEEEEARRLDWASMQLQDAAFTTGLSLGHEQRALLRALHAYDRGATLLFEDGERYEASLLDCTSRFSGVLGD